MINRRAFLRGLTAALVVKPITVEAQQPAARVYRVGVVLEGGPYYAAVDGLKDGLKELGFQEGKQYILHIRDLKGDVTATATMEMARSLEQEKVDLIYAIGSSVCVAVKRATSTVPIVVYLGGDPVALGLIASFAKPGGRVTGVNSRRISSCKFERRSRNVSTNCNSAVLSVRKVGAVWVCGAGEFQIDRPPSSDFS